MDLTTMLVAATDSNPAAGAAAWEAILATAVGVGMTLALVALGWAHRSDRTRVLARAAERASRATGLPGWAALPSAIKAVSLIVAVIGMYWDISIHIAEGRDAGPFANPAHFLILFGLFGIFVAGFCAIVLPEGRPGPAALQLGEDWYAPLGGIGLLAASSFALLGFPLDDFWHRIFGQDVTLWGPTHLMMIGGATLAFVGQTTLLGEAKLAERDPDRSTAAGRRVSEVIDRLRVPALCGGFLIGLSTFQGEFDFGVPQFRMLFAPVLIALAAGAGLVAARIYGGRYMALYAALFFAAVRGGLALLVGPVLGEPTPHLPLYLAEALLVEGAALVIAPRVRPYPFALLCGSLIGTIGFGAEYAWSHLWMPIPWQPALIGEALLPATAIAIAAALVGAFVATAWRAPIRTGSRPAQPLSPTVALGAVLVIGAVVAYGLQTSPQSGVSAAVSVRDLAPAPNREVEATVRIDPPAATSGTDWLNATAWQGGGFQVDPLEPVGDPADGVYRTTAPLPVHGSWKSLIRIQKGDSIIGAPIYLPADSAIGASAVPARAVFERPLIADSKILQREQLDGVPGWTKSVAYATVGMIVASIVLLLGWILTRLASAYAEPASAPAQSVSHRRRRNRLSRPAGGSA